MNIKILKGMSSYFLSTLPSFEDAVYIVWQKQKTPISWEKWTIWG